MLYVSYDEDQESPAISGDIVVWEQNMGSHWDIMAADISDPDNPDVMSIAALPSNARYPAIDGRLIVWQDDRNGMWDIYGYNLVTHQEFRITDYQSGQTVFSNQTSPAIDGNVVVWVDDLSGTPQIYATCLEGPEVAQCMGQPGDANGDCQVNLLDLTEMSRNWLSCGLDYQSACQ
jgi:beta propeller repeat protein